METDPYTRIDRLERELAEVKAELQAAHKYGSECQEILIEACGEKETLGECRDELARLREIEAKLPRTADGVPVVPGRDFVWAWTLKTKTGLLSAKGPRLVQARVALASTAEYGATGKRPIDTFDLSTQCYSTEEAARNSRQEVPRED